MGSVGESPKRLDDHRHPAKSIGVYGGKTEGCNGAGTSIHAGDEESGAAANGKRVPGSLAYMEAKSS